MRVYWAFSKKEFVEFWRTYKLVIMMAVFILFGIMSPLVAKVTPQLLESVMPEDMQIIMGEPTALDSWAQFFKNVSQMGLIIMAIIYSSMMAGEFSKGTLINILTKGLPRKIVVLAKFTVATVVWTAGYFICSFLCYLYTNYYWGKGGVFNLPFSLFCLWLFGILLIAAILFLGVLTKKAYGSLLGTGGLVLVLSLVNIVPKIKKYNPFLLASANMPLLTGAKVPKDLTIAVLVNILLIVAMIILSIQIFNKKKI